ncbi:MAG: N-acetyl-gamma-glutamyl-phosphate reductase [Hyphomicrobiaceae bacterium]
MSTSAQSTSAKSASARTPGPGHHSNKPAVFIDGEAGTTGLEIRERLARLPAFDVKSIDPEKRKDPTARQALMKEVDLVVLCLPDDAAREATALADDLGDAGPRIVDASTAHRVADGWTYGFPEMSREQEARIRSSRRVANPGCYPTGGIGLVRPLVDAGLMPADYPVTVNAVSGYSGGGKAMIEAYTSGNGPLFELYGLGLEHKHVPELQHFSGLTRRPIFVPSVGNYLKDMLVSVPLHLDTLPGTPRVRDLEACLEAHYAGCNLVKVISADDPSSKGGRLDALALNDTDKLELRVFGSDKHRQAVLVARLDNLGKGAAGAAVQNIGLMLGVET